ncbi:MAG: DNA/RNA nuclease SfsA [Candidatus Aminicenantia bacterium]
MSNVNKLILEYRNPLIKGYILSQPNRFTLLVEFNSKAEKVYLPNPGKLSTVLERGREILCTKAKAKRRKTNLNAFAVKLNGIYATVNSLFANTIFENAIKRKLLSDLKDFSLEDKEKLIPEYGRIDFVLKNLKGEQLLVEVKSCTHVENGIAKFPDRPTERGRKHLKILGKIGKDGINSIVVFVIQRPDALSFKAFKEIDQEFAHLLKEIYHQGVGIRAISTEFVPPDKIYLENDNLLINF